MRTTLGLPTLLLLATAVLITGCKGKERLVFQTELASASTDETLPEIRVAVVPMDSEKPIEGTDRLVTLALGANPGTSELLGQLSVGVVKGVATFTDVRLNKAGTGYTLIATAEETEQVESPAFDIRVGTGARLSFEAQPPAVKVNLPFAVTLAVLDATENAPTTSTATVYLSLNDATHTAFLSGSTVSAAQDGKLTVSNLVVDRAGTGYTLTAYSPGLASVTSAPFDVASVPASAPELVSVAADGTSLGNTDCGTVCISADGRYVGFLSQSTNLDAVAETGNADWDLFLRDREAKKTSRVTVSTSGGEADGETTGRCTLSADGRFLAFVSAATNLVSSDPSPAIADLFVLDRTSKTLTAVTAADAAIPSQNAFQIQGPSLSPDGTMVAFSSGYPGFLTPAKASNQRDVWFRTWQGTLGAASRANLDSNGMAANGDASSSGTALSKDGTFIAFSSGAGNLVLGDNNGSTDVFVRNRSTGATERVSIPILGGEPAGGSSTNPAITPDGRFVAYESSAANVVTDDLNSARDVFLRDRLEGTTTYVSAASDGEHGNGESYSATISGDGRYVAFLSDASNLVAGDFNGETDVFVRDVQTGVVVRVNVQTDGTPTGHHDTASAAISDDGKVIAFTTSASLITATNWEHQVYVVRNPLLP